MGSSGDRAAADARTVDVWRAMTPRDRDYDRLIAGRVPQAVLQADGRSAWTPETQEGRDLADRYYDLDDEALDEIGCTCMRSAPCSWCLTHCPDCRRRVEGEDFEAHVCGD